MAKLKMVAGKTYCCPAVFGDRVVARGEVVDVPDAHVQHLTEASYLDASNNEHFYFKETDEELSEGVAVTKPTTEKATAKSKAGSRTRAAKSEE